MCSEFILFETVYWKTWGQNKNLNGNYLLARSSTFVLFSAVNMDTKLLVSVYIHLQWGV